MIWAALYVAGVLFAIPFSWALGVYLGWLWNLFLRGFALGWGDKL